MQYCLVSLGCAKNLVDSELMMGMLTKKGWSSVQDPKKADAIIVNTCSFIESAINESIDTILELARYKQEGHCRFLIVTGCLPQRFKDELVQTLPEVDIFLGTGAFHKIVKAVSGPAGMSASELPDPDGSFFCRGNIFRELSSSYMAYLKIAEGCSRHCTYCIIPKLRGRQKSRPINNIIREVDYLIENGIKEIILVAQDTTAYGMDLSPQVSFNSVLISVAERLKNIWIRFMYGHPESINDSIFETVKSYANIVPYFDIPIQHVSDRLLQRMGRNYTSYDLEKLFEKIRTMVPDAVLRTSVIVGFPGETDKDFKSLFNFVQNMHFDNLGAFIYSDFTDLASHRMDHHVPARVAQDRYDRIMSCQLEISRQNNRKHVGKIYDVLIEEAVENGLFAGRTAFQAPEVDGIVYVEAEELAIGSFVGVKIVDALEYDLKGEAVWKN